MTLYLDIIFLENLFMNSIILYTTGYILKKKIKIIKLVLASAIGATYSILMYIVNNKIVSNILLKLILSFLIIYVSFKEKNIKNIIKNIITFYFVSFTFGGVSIAVIYLINPQDVMPRMGVLIATPSIYTIVIAGIIACIIIIAVFKSIRKKISKTDMLCTVKIKDENIKVMLDTGNFLKDPITAMPVIVIEKSRLKNVFPEDILNNITKVLSGEKIGLEATEKIKEYYLKIHMIPYKSLGQKNGMLLGIKVNNVYLKYQKEEYVKDAIIGIYNDSISKRGEYHGLVGLDFIN